MIFKKHPRKHLNIWFSRFEKKNMSKAFKLFFASLRDLKEDQTQIRFNLVVAIAIAQITFLAGIDATEVKVS